MPPITIGRIVHYRDEGGAVVPAIVTAVHSDDLVNLTVFNDGNGLTRGETSVEKQDETDGASIENRRWFWPPRVESADPSPNPAEAARA